MESQEVLDSKMTFHSGDNVNVEFLDDLDTMMDDIEDRLKIARMVSDSVIKGMVTAVEQDTNDKLMTKELELDNLKRSNLDFKGYLGFDDARVKHDKMKDSVIDEFKKLRKQIEGVRGCKIKRNGSCHELAGLGSILKEECDLEKSVDKLETMMNDMFKLVDTVFVTSDASFSERKNEHELKGEVNQHELFHEAGSQSSNLTDKFNSISDLLNELESLKKLLPSSDSGSLISHGSLDVDNIHGNPLRSQLSSRWEENGKSSKSKPDVPDSLDTKLSHMNKDDLIKYFNNMILNLKREHEAEVHELGDKYISLKGKLLNESRSFVLPSKDFEVLKKKIPEVVSKLDDILSESDEFIRNGNSVARLNTLARENRQLRDSLDAKKDEVKYISSQLSVISENHSSFMADTFFEASIVEDTYKCVIQELKCQIQDIKDESELEIVAMQDIYEVLLENTSSSAIEDTCRESKFMQELLETVFQETILDVKQNFENLYKVCITTSEDLVSLEKKETELEVELKLETEEKEKLKNEVHMLRNLVKETEMLAKNELNTLRKQASWQETLVLKTNKELDEMNDKLLKAQEKLVFDEIEIDSLNQKLELAIQEIKTSSDYKNMVLALSEEKQNLMSLIEMKEKEHRKRMEAIVVLVDELSTNFSEFECRVTMDTENNNTRLKSSSSQLSFLIKSANVMKSTGIQYKQKLERKCADLKMAEDEVDLLGDEVDTLLGLLEKIYIALDHYSPVLQHYPGVTDILKLVRRELSGESSKRH